MFDSRFARSGVLSYPCLSDGRYSATITISTEAWFSVFRWVFVTRASESAFRVRVYGQINAGCGPKYRISDRCIHDKRRGSCFSLYLAYTMYLNCDSPGVENARTPNFVIFSELWLLDDSSDTRANRKYGKCPRSGVYQLQDRKGTVN